MENKLTSIVSGILSAVASLLLLLAVVDWIMRLFGWTFSWIPYQPGRLLEFAAYIMVFVIVILLWQIREKLKS